MLKTVLPGANNLSESNAKSVFSDSSPGQTPQGRENGSKMLTFVKQHGIDSGLLGIARGEMFEAEGKKSHVEDLQMEEKAFKQEKQNPIDPVMSLEREFQQTREELARLRGESEAVKQVLILLALLQREKEEEKEEEKRKELIEALIKLTTLFLNGIITGKPKEYSEENTSVPGGI